MKTDGKQLMRVHPSWTDPAYWARNDRYIALDYSPRPSKTYWVWPDQEGK